MADGLESVVIIGAGQAGGQAAYSLRLAGYDGAITLIGDEPAPPYQRPPLSKGYLKGDLDEERLYLKPAEYYREHAIKLELATAVDRIDLAAREVATRHGRIAFDRLVIATGARPRKLPLAGSDLDGVLELRTLADIDALKPRLTPGARLLVVGAGYIGLEAAAVARKLGAEVTVLEAAPQVLSRVAGPEIGDFFTRLHSDAGVDIRLNARLVALTGDTKVTGASMWDGETIDCDVVLLGVGILPNMELAAEAGIACGNGILVNAQGRTSDPNVFAAGDVAWRPLVHYGREGRLESVHNAIEGGKIAAAAILGQPTPALEAPWFWSDQYDIKLQTAGLSTGADQRVVRGDPATGKFAVFYLKEGRFLAVDAVNSGPEFIVGKKLAATQARVAPAELADTSISMKDIAARAAGQA